ncbi:MAG: T9SS type A sorting domain-containing protein [Chitinophagales bacterium]|nr:T9SS type A sorting domain-containing protein [Chitinophagales bacterium]
MITVLKANNNQAVLNASFFTKGMYVLRIKTTDGEITNKKVVKQ